MWHQGSLFGDFTDDTGEVAVSSHEPESLLEWWQRTSTADIEGSLAKISWYGSGDLLAVGRLMAQTTGRSQFTTDAEAAELGCLFYMAGKWARVAEAMKRGDQPDADTLFDLQFYTMMIRRIRDTGSWPGPVEVTP